MGDKVQKLPSVRRLPVYLHKLLEMRRAGQDIVATPELAKYMQCSEIAVRKDLAFTGAVKDQILDTEELASHLLSLLAELAPQALAERYKLTETAGLQGWELLEACAKKRGFLVSRGEADTLRMANVLLDEYRGGKLGRLSLEVPEC